MSWLRTIIEQIACSQVERDRLLFDRINQLEKNMSQELKDAVARITASSKRLIDDAVSKLQQGDPDVAGAIASLNAASDALDTESTALEGTGSGGGDGGSPANGG